MNIPQWLKNIERSKPQSEEQLIELAIQIAKRNVQNNTGGPFGAAIYDKNKKLLSVGANLVIRNNCSLLHAEVVAILLAQKKLKTYDLSAVGAVLATSAEPCIMCQGAIYWSGITKVIYAASTQDVEKIGFKEGNKLPIEKALKNISIVQLAQEKAIQESLNIYKGPIYNADI
mgnify:FL=1|jgi:tRNA(Arg) A34 adenosine deaminase TadA